MCIRDSLTVVSVEKSRKTTMSPGLYDLTELQRDANRKFGFSAKETLNIMQRLYENHKVDVYKRQGESFNHLIELQKDFFLFFWKVFPKYLEKLLI